MKKILRQVSIAMLTAALICGCSQVTDELPDSFNETDIISESLPVTPFSEQTTSAASETTSAVSETSSETVISKADISETADTSIESDTEPSVSEALTAVPTETETETETSSETTSETVTETEFVPGTLPPETTAATAPPITIVTLPTLPESTVGTLSENPLPATEAH